MTEYLRTLDQTALDRTEAGVRFTQQLLATNDGRPLRNITVMKSPPGDKSRRGVHTHDFDQLYYILRGTLSLDIDGQPVHAGAGSLVVIPAGVPHHNWNGGDEDVVQLLIESREIAGNTAVS